jgi:hypothetical protein
LASKLVTTVSDGLILKSAVTVFTSLTSKPVATVFTGLASKPVVTVFSSLASKLVATVSSDLALKPVIGFLAEPQNQDGRGFPGLVVKTGSSGLMIWTSKSLRRFLGLSVKTKWASICRLHHKTNEGRSTWDTLRDLVACFTYKQI